jgi:hypothetical protein
MIDEPTARIRRQDLQVLVQASRLGAMVVVPVPVLDVVPETTVPVRPLPPPTGTATGRVPVNPVTVVVAFFVAVGVGFVATVPFW